MNQNHQYANINVDDNINDIDIDTNNDIAIDNTPILIACRQNAGKIIDWIYNMDKSVINMIDSNGYSPLYVAAMRGNNDAVNALLSFDEIKQIYYLRPKMKETQY